MAALYTLVKSGYPNFFCRNPSGEEVPLSFFQRTTATTSSSGSTSSTSASGRVGSTFEVGVGGLLDEIQKNVKIVHTEMKLLDDSTAS